MSRFSTRFAAGLVVAAAVLTAGALPAAAADPVATTLTAQASTTRVDAGQPVTVSGKLTGAGKPVAGVTVGISFCIDDFCGEFDAQPVTDAQGRYQAKVTPVRSGTYRADFLPADEAYAPSGATTAAVTVIQPASVTSFTAVRGADGTITAAGTVDFPRFTPSSIPVRVEYLTVGPLRRATAFTTEAQWNGTAFAFTGTAQLRTPGLWRAVYAGVPNEFHAASSALVLVR